MIHTPRVIFLIIIFAISVASCTTIDRHAMVKVKKVAIIGFRGRIVEGGGGALIEYANAITDQAFGPKLYQLMQKQLKADLGWRFVSRAKVSQSPSYKKFHGTKSNKMIDAINYKDKFILIPSILSSTMAAGMLGDPKLRSALARELGVDAFLNVEFSIEPETFSSSASDRILGSIGKKSTKVSLLKCRLSLDLIEAKTWKTIWKQPDLYGKNGRSPSVRIYGIPFPNLKQRAVVSAFTNALNSHVSQVKAN